MIGKSLAQHSELETAIEWEQLRRYWFLHYGHTAKAQDCEKRIDFYFARLQNGA